MKKIAVISGNAHLFRKYISDKALPKNKYPDYISPNGKIVKIEESEYIRVSSIDDCRGIEFDEVVEGAGWWNYLKQDVYDIAMSRVKASK